MLDGSRYYLSEAAEHAFRDYLTQRMQQPRFANARSAPTDWSVPRSHAQRLASDLHRDWTRDASQRGDGNLRRQIRQLLQQQFQSYPGGPPSLPGKFEGGRRTCFYRAIRGGGFDSQRVGSRPRRSPRLAAPVEHIGSTSVPGGGLAEVSRLDTPRRSGR